MLYPLKDKFYITQGFGENHQIYKQFGLNGHNGIDFRTKFPDTPQGKRYVYSSKDGKVSEITNQGSKGYGLYIRLSHEGNEQTIYGHLARVYIVKGQQVKKGQRIGLTDNTGFSTGAHLHFGYRPNGFNYNNGYKGYIDPMPFLKKEGECPDIKKELEKQKEELKDLIINYLKTL